MKLSIFIATRYLMARKSHNLINVITWISIVGVSVGTFALIVVLSAFNGLEEVISSMAYKLTPDLSITPIRGKTLSLDSISLVELRSVNGVESVEPSITEDALFRVGDKQHIGKVKGVSLSYQDMDRFQDIVVNDRQLMLSDDSRFFAVPGSSVAWRLGIDVYDPYSLLTVYIPQRGNASSFQLETGFYQGSLNVTSVFQTQQDLDEQVVLVPYQWLSPLMDYQGRASELEVFVSSGADVRKVKKTVKNVLGEDYQVRDQREQQATLHKIMNSEKWAVFLILTFILIMATFNVVGSLNMLIVDKKKDVGILRAMGADRSLLRSIFLGEGLLISVVGGVIGLVVGIIVVVLQQEFGFVKFGDGGSYIVSAYPVALKLKDVLLVFVTIVMIGGMSAFLTVQRAMRKLDEVLLRSR